MATAIKLPSVGTNVDAVTLIGWLKNVGDKVRRGEPLCEIETDKAVTELESAGQGVLLAQLAAAGDSVSEGQILAYVGQPGESVPADADGQDQPQPAAQTPEPPETPKAAAQAPVSPATVAPARPAPAPAAQRPIPAGPAGGKPGRASILLRTLARRQGVDLSRLIGTGPGGFITRDDLSRARSGEAPMAPAYVDAPRPSPQAPATAATRPQAVYELQLDLSALRRRARREGKPDAPWGKLLVAAGQRALQSAGWSADGLTVRPAGPAGRIVPRLMEQSPAALAIAAVGESVVSEAGCLRSATVASACLCVDASQVAPEQAERCLQALKDALERA